MSTFRRTISILAFLSLASAVITTVFWLRSYVHGPMPGWISVRLSQGGRLVGRVGIVPFSLLTFAFLVLPSVWLRLRFGPWRISDRITNGQCHGCGYDLR